MELYDREVVQKIAFTDEDLYEVLSKNHNVSYIMLNCDSKRENNIGDSRTIGLLSNDFDPNNNVYNQLSALSLVNYDKVKLMSNMVATEPFLKMFNIKYEISNDINYVLNNNYVNMYANFTNTSIELVLKSIYAGIPCILGNTSLFDDYPILKENLVLKSDDDINEIAEKVNGIDSVRKVILEEYKNFKKDYSMKTVKLLKEFLD
jgi:hypothetical protein